MSSSVLSSSRIEGNNGQQDNNKPNWGNMAEKPSEIAEKADGYGKPYAF